MAYGGAVTMHTLAALAFIGSLFYYADKARWVTDTIISDAGDRWLRLRAVEPG